MTLVLADAPGGGSEDNLSAAVDVVNLFTAVLTDSPTNRQHMIQISGIPHPSNIHNPPPWPRFLITRRNLQFLLFTNSFDAQPVHTLRVLRWMVKAGVVIYGPSAAEEQS
jgi:hypothetical protein